MECNNEFSNFFFNKAKKFKISKWPHYFDIYDKHFNRFKGTTPTILEIGVKDGGSIEMWNDYFSGECTIYGVDCMPHCKQIEKHFNNVHICIGDQGNINFWNEFKVNTPQFDILLDDGGHTMEQQIITYEQMYSQVKDNGVYMCEDTHTSYWSKFGGGLKNSNSYIEYTKNFIDKLNSYHTGDKDHTFRRSTHSITYYDSVVVFEKKKETGKILTIKSFHDSQTNSIENNIEQV